MSLTERERKQTSYILKGNKGTDLRVLVAISQLKINCLTIASNNSSQFKFLNGVKIFSKPSNEFLLPKRSFWEEICQAENFP